MVGCIKFARHRGVIIAISRDMLQTEAFRMNVHTTHSPARLSI